MRRFPFHPLLFGLFPLLFLFAENAERVTFGKIVRPGLVVLGLIAVVTVVAWLVLRNPLRGAIVGSGAAILGLSYGHVWNQIRDNAIGPLVVGRDLFLVPLWMILAFGFVLLAWRVKALPETTAIFNALAIGLVIVAMVNVTGAVARQRAQPISARVGERSGTIAAADANTPRPDVYYLVFDRYGSRSVLDEFVGFDNGPFVRELEERGFMVADEARSNYPTTAHSLASSLNLDYLDELGRGERARSKDWRPLYKQLVGPRLSRFFQGEGYAYAHIGPWYDPTANDPTAQVNYHYDARSEFTRILLETTAVRPLAKRMGFLEDIDGRRLHHNQIKFQLDAIVDASKLEGPTFTFAHVLLPHEPFTFDKSGGYLEESDERARTWELGYSEQVTYANARILDIVDRIRSRSRDSIIVVQSDEGPKRKDWEYGGKQRWEAAPDDVLREKFGILTAVSVPECNAFDLPEDSTPVNLWRRLLTACFGADLELLPDRQIAYGTNDEPYRFTDVTKRLED